MQAEAQSYYESGILKAAEGNYDAAEYHLLQSLEIEPLVPAYATLGWIYASRFNQFQRAMRMFRKAIRITPEDGDLLNDFGALLIKMGEPKRALKFFYRSLKSEICTRQHYALYNMALIYKSWNRPERSRRYLNLSLRYKPDFIVAKELLEKIKSSDSRSI